MRCTRCPDSSIRSRRLSRWLRPYGLLGRRRFGNPSSIDHLATTVPYGNDSNARFMFHSAWLVRSHLAHLCLGAKRRVTALVRACCDRSCYTKRKFCLSCTTVSRLPTALRRRPFRGLDHLSRRDFRFVVWGVHFEIMSFSQAPKGGAGRPSAAPRRRRHQPATSLARRGRGRGGWEELTVAARVPQ